MSSKISPRHKLFDLMRVQKSFRSYKTRDSLLGFLLILPTIIVVGGIVLRPLLDNIIQSFTDMKIQQGEVIRVFVGLNNIQYVLKSNYVWNAFLNSTILTLVATILTVVLAVFLAILIDAPFVGRNFVRTILIIPWAMPVIVTAFAWQFLADVNYGLFNRWLLDLHLISAPINWLAYKNSAWFIVISANVWKGLPFILLVVIAALKQIPAELYDCARIDGASGIAILWNVIIPGIRGPLAIAIVLRAIWFFNWFDLVYLLTGGGPGRSTEILPIIAYRTAFQEMKFGRGAFIANIMLIVLSVLVIIYSRYRSKLEKESYG